ncbi:RNA polymerase sigma factor [Rufibacter roseus]|uniref:RNA polymerase sigma factor n=1 Tax=Rufibacter roseus TaxID=1567108 RepID=A0ABW2DR73_9BACT|nr:sigma-70 family RNA polymerase sigma factor [Rufibacter roseus]
MFLKLFSRAKPPDDLELVQQYQQTGDVDCIGTLFERHTEMVYLVCRKYLKVEEESRDAAMQIFENLLTSLKKHEVTNFKSWLHTTSKNHCLMLLRSAKNKTTQTLDEKLVLSVESSAHLHPPNEEQHEQELQLLEQGLIELGTEQRTCLELFYLQQKSYKEVADLTGWELNKVKSYIQNGKRNLKHYLEKNYEQP